jgi:hypothetical protein
MHPQSPLPKCTLEKMISILVKSFSENRIWLSGSGSWPDLAQPGDPRFPEIREIRGKVLSRLGELLNTQQNVHPGLPVRATPDQIWQF